MDERANAKRLPGERAEPDADFYRRLLGVPLCERTGECNGCGRCGEVGRNAAAMPSRPDRAPGLRG